MKHLELDISFSRDYFTKRFDIHFRDSYFDDVCLRAETDQAVKRALYRQFGDCGLGEPDPAPVVQLGYDDTLNITLMFGGEVHVSEGVSWTSTGFLRGESIADLQVPDIPSTWPHTKFLEQYDAAVALCGREGVRPPKPHGILESALEMRGQEFLEDLALDPARATHLLDVLTETVIAVKEFWDRKCWGRVEPGLSLGSCSTTTLSPEHVMEFLVPRYNTIASHFGRAFLCSCGISTHNLENFAAVKDAFFVRCGWGTDLAAAARVLHDRHLKLGLDVSRVAGQTPAELHDDVTAMLNQVEQLERASILLIHASAETPDANIRQLARTARDWAQDRGVEFVQN